MCCFVVDFEAIGMCVYLLRANVHYIKRHVIWFLWVADSLLLVDYFRFVFCFSLCFRVSLWHDAHYIFNHSHRQNHPLFTRRREFVWPKIDLALVCWPFLNCISQSNVGNYNLTWYWLLANKFTFRFHKIVVISLTFFSFLSMAKLQSECDVFVSPIHAFAKRWVAVQRRAIQHNINFMK